MSSEPITKTNEKIHVQVSWAGLDTTPTVPVNQFITAVGLPAETGEPDGIHVVLGHLGPLLLLGNEEEVLRKARQLGEIHVEVKGRYLLSRSRTEELIKVLQNAVKQYDQVTKVARGE